MTPPRLFRNASLLLLIAEVFLIASSALWTDDPHDRPILMIMYTLLFCAGGYTLAHSSYWLKTYIPLSVIAIAFSFSTQNTLHTWIHYLAIIGIQVMLFYAIIRHSFFKQNVSRTDRIIAGVAGYLLLGLFWHSLMVLQISLGSPPLLDQIQSKAPNLGNSLYFTFVTLTTLGYGDIVPITPISKVVTIFTSLTGNLYLAIFISSLISKTDDK